MPESNAMLKYVSGGIDTSTGGKVFKTKSAIISGAEDTRSDAISVITIEHNKVHTGYHYTAAINEKATASTDFINVFFLGRGSTYRKRHMVIEASANQAGTIYLYEDILTSGGGGTTYNPINNDRGSTNLSDHKIEIQGTTHSCSTGTLLWSQAMGQNAPPIRIGGASAQREEYIFASSLDYELRFDATQNNTSIFINATWYEE